MSGFAFIIDPFGGYNFEKLLVIIINDLWINPIFKDEILEKNNHQNKYPKIRAKNWEKFHKKKLFSKYFRIFEKNTKFIPEKKNLKIFKFKKL